MKAQIIMCDGAPEYAVIPYAEYEKLLEAAEWVEDIRDYDRIKARLASGEEESLPAEVAHRLGEGEHPVRVWREYRGFSVQALADRCGISQAYLSQIETGKRDGRLSVVRALARELTVSVEDLTQD